MMMIVESMRMKETAEELEAEDKLVLNGQYGE